MLVTEQPKDLPTTNALAGLVPTVEPAEIRLSGKVLCVLAEPPALGTDLTLMIKVHVTENCVAEHADGATVFYRKTKLVAAWKPGDPEPIDPDQGSLWEQAPPEGTFNTNEQ
jgi:hypothetical protein